MSANNNEPQVVFGKTVSYSIASSPDYREKIFNLKLPKIDSGSDDLTRRPLSKPIACKNCNRINFTGTHCKNCQEELVIVDQLADAKPAASEEAADAEKAKAEIANRVAEELTNEQEKSEDPSDSKTPIEVQDKIPKTQIDSNKRRILQKNLKAKLRDSRMTRAPLTKETEILGKNGKRIAGARKVPVTQMLPVTNTAQPWSPM